MRQMSEAAKKRIYELFLNSKPFNDEFVAFEEGYKYGLFDQDANKELLDKVEEFLRNAPLMSGVCCCGMEMKDHGFQHGHSAVDSGEYAIEQMIEKIREARK